MNISNLDIVETEKFLQEKVKNESVVTFLGVPVLKMNFLALFSIIEDEVATRIYLPYDQDEFRLVAERIVVDGSPLNIIYNINPERPEYVVCPSCNGSGTVDELVCNNCGGQYNNPTARGVVLKKMNGQGCVHTYTLETIKNNYIQYRCNECGDSYHKTL